MNVQLHAYIDDTTFETTFHCVVLNGFLCSMYEPLMLSRLVKRPWKEFLLWIIGSDEAHLPLLLKDTTNG
jgi:hypothetical protein